MIALGIDPGCTATGFAVVDLDAHKVLALRTVKGDFEARRQAAADMEIRHHPTLVAIQVPIPEDGKIAFYNRGPDGKPRNVAAMIRHTAATYELVGYYRGAVRQAQEMGFALTLVEVCSQGRKGQGLKMDAKRFNIYWQYEGRSSEHARDAAAIAAQAAMMMLGAKA